MSFISCKLRFLQTNLTGVSYTITVTIQNPWLLINGYLRLYHLVSRAGFQGRKKYVKIVVSGGGECSNIIHVKS